MVFTASYLKRRGYCCGNGCRHCPYTTYLTSAVTKIGTSKYARLDYSQSCVALCTTDCCDPRSFHEHHAMNIETDDNPLLAKWEGPYGGVPPFDRVQVALFKPALEAAMAEQLAEIERIANNPAPPISKTPSPRSTHRPHTRPRGDVYGVWSSTMANPEFQAVQREMAPRLAAFSDQITQNEALFKRIDAVYNSPAKARLTAEQQRVDVALLHELCSRRRASRAPSQRHGCQQINQRLAGLYT